MIPGLGLVARTGFDPVLPSVLITNLSHTIYFNTLQCTLSVTGGNITVFEAGICWSDVNNLPTVGDSKKVIGSALGNLSNNNITYFKGTTTYYVRPYVKYQETIAYGPVVQITTNQAPTVDLQGWIKLSATRISVSGYYLGNGNPQYYMGCGIGVWDMTSGGEQHIYNIMTVGSVFTNEFEGLIVGHRYLIILFTYVNGEEINDGIEIIFN